MSKTVIVTGGAGFIGSHLVDAMIERGYRVAVIDDLSSGSKTNLNPQAEFYELDIRSDEAINVIKQTKPNLIFHFAAQISVPESFRDPLKDTDLNLISTIK
ncbi:NAD-dependent epimerase/dehydratase family protein, partial [Candidatus Uhrbacteria bacterium]|nr:NAD-dependent epimerase/dehydratase family protein [Candidatus Uhrbacteria bacterium]